MMKKNIYVGAVIVCAVGIVPLATLAAFSDLYRQKLQEQVQEMQQKQAALKQESQNGSTTMRDKVAELRGAMQDEMMKKREAFQANGEVRRAELKKKLGEQKAVRIEEFFSRMMEKFEDAIDRLNGVADRIEARINGLPAGAPDATALKDKLIAARAKITDARIVLEGAKAKYADAIKSPDFKTAFRSVRDIVQEAAAKVKDAHAALIEVVVALKPGQQGVASSTSATATSSVHTNQ